MQFCFGSENGTAGQDSCSNAIISEDWEAESSVHQENATTILKLHSCFAILDADA